MNMNTSIPMIHVSSSQLAFIGYDDDTNELYVKFINGSVYKYSNVPELVFKELRDSTSIGSYFSKYIKNTYTCSQV